VGSQKVIYSPQYEGCDIPRIGGLTVLELSSRGEAEPLDRPLHAHTCRRNNNRKTRRNRPTRKASFKTRGRLLSTLTP
jgi:hypothetical protein